MFITLPCGEWVIITSQLRKYFETKEEVSWHFSLCRAAHSLPVSPRGWLTITSSVQSLGSSASAQRLTSTRFLFQLLGKTNLRFYSEYWFIFDLKQKITRKLYELDHTIPASRQKENFIYQCKLSHCLESPKSNFSPISEFLWEELYFYYLFQSSSCTEMNFT